VVECLALGSEARGGFLAICAASPYQSALVASLTEGRRLSDILRSGDTLVVRWLEGRFSSGCENSFPLKENRLSTKPTPA
jgi:hypothetical protein